MDALTMKKHSQVATSVAPKGIARARRSNFPTRYQAKLAAYLAAGHHLVFDADRQRRGLNPYCAKPITQVAAETGMSTTRATYWLKQEHYALWLRWWSGFDAALWDKVEAEHGPICPQPGQPSRPRT